MKRTMLVIWHIFIRRKVKRNTKKKKLENGGGNRSESFKLITRGGVVF